MAMFCETEYSHIIQPIPYRAPEVILGMKWNESEDIWNFGVLVSTYKSQLEVRLFRLRVQLYLSWVNSPSRYTPLHTKESW